MARIEKTVFISYRRTDVYTALAVYENLKNQGYDIFFDYRSIASGDFEQIISSNIKARAHFLLILTPGALDRCDDPEDWLRREIELAIDEKRNIIPLFFKGFRFGAPSVTEKLTGKLINLGRYNGLNVHEDYFDEAMYRLRTEYLNKPLNTILHPVSTEVRKVVQEEQIAADKALEQIEDVKELVKHPDEGPVIIKESQKVITKQSGKDKVASRVQSNVKLRRLMAGSAIGLTIIALCVASGLLISNGLRSGVTGIAATPTLHASSTSNEETSPTSATEAATDTFDLASTIAAAPSLSPEELTTSTALLGTVLAGLRTQRADQTTGKDGMLLLYVPAGEFMMGSDNGEDNEKPAHTVYVDAFWIDRTEVTNKMYSTCVNAGVCETPLYKYTTTRNTYYGSSAFDNYPVVWVNWYMAKTYCEWVGRKLPSEAQWEKAARGTDGRIYPWGNSIDCTYANYNVACEGDTSEVGAYPKGASPYGALDMAGNVFEWVTSLRLPYPYDSTDGREDLNTAGSRALRGGSFGPSNPNEVLSTFRRQFPPNETFSAVGFRCVIDATP